MRSTITVQVGGTKVTLERQAGGEHAAELGDGADVLLVVYQPGIDSKAAGLGNGVPLVAVAVAQVDWSPVAHQAHVVARALGVDAQDAADALPVEAVSLVRRAA